MKTRFDNYRMFYETARFRSFSTAAQHLYISQSAISQCMHQLETDLGVQLFIRSRQGVTLTHEGKLLFRKVENAVISIEQGENQLDRLRHLASKYTSSTRAACRSFGVLSKMEKGRRT